MKRVAYFIVLCGFIGACHNDLETIKKVTSKTKGADISNKDIVVFYSDSGIVKAKLTSPEMDNYFAVEPYVEFPKGLKMVFFDEDMNTTSSLTADYAIRKEKDKTLEAKRNVQVINEKGEQLNTEHLIWDEEKEKIVSDAFVKIKTKDEIIYGDGFESNQDFTKYKIFKIKGTINLKK